MKKKRENVVPGRYVDCPVCGSPKIPVGLIRAHIGGERCCTLKDAAIKVTDPRYGIGLTVLAAGTRFDQAIKAGLEALRGMEKS